MKKKLLLIVSLIAPSLYAMDSQRMLDEAAQFEHDTIYQDDKPKSLKMDPEYSFIIQPRDQANTADEIEKWCAACCVTGALVGYMPIAWAYDKYQDYKQKLD